MRFQSPTKPGASIDIAPLVDVVFLLVIFFAVSTTFLENSGLALDLPESSSTAERIAEDLTVQLGLDGTLTFEGQQLEREALAEKLRHALEQRESKRVVLRADSGTRHGEVVKIMDLIRKAGATALTVAARPESGPS